MHTEKRRLHCTRTDYLQCAPGQILCSVHQNGLPVRPLPPDYPSLCEEENYTDENHDYGDDEE